MNANQKTELLAACEQGNEVRIVTIALQIAASAARSGDLNTARDVRSMVDDHHKKEHMAAEKLRMRDEFAKAALPGIVVGSGQGTPVNLLAGWCYQIADAMLAAREDKTSEVAV